MDFVQKAFQKLLIGFFLNLILNFVTFITKENQIIGQNEFHESEIVYVSKKCPCFKYQYVLYNKHNINVLQYIYDKL